MRTIKFRLVKDNKIVSTQELKPNGIIDCPVEWDIACQFTGLLDKQGREVYEGDILQQELYGGLKNKRVVKWFQEQCCFAFEGTIYAISPLEKEKASWYKIIGNIYENPELLKDSL